MTNSLRDRAFVVTGAASGIGKGTAEALDAAGASVGLADRDEGGLRAVAGALGDHALVLPTDVSDEAQVQQAVDATVAAFGRLDGVVTSAGVFDPADLVDVEAVDLDVFDQVLSINLRGTLLVLRAALPLLGPGSSVVTVASTAGLRGHGFGPAYTASKGGVVALTRLVAVQYGPRGIRANCVCPGATAGEGMGAAFAEPEFARSMTRDVPLRRVGQAAELGTMIATLLSDDTSYVTGQVIAVDGGVTAR